MLLLRGTTIVSLLLTAVSLMAFDVGGISLHPGLNDQVSVSRKDWAWRSGAKSFPAVNIAMNSGRAAYTVRHDLVTSGGTLGFCVPSTCNWYQSGMLDVRLNGKRIGMSGDDGETIEFFEGTDRGTICFSWRHPETDLRVMFVLPRGCDCVYVEVQLTPHVPVQTLGVHLRNYPGGFNRKPEHVLYTGTRMINEQGEAQLAFPGDDALLFCDRTLDVASNPKGAGPCAVVLGCGGLQSGRVRFGSYGTTTELNYDPSTRRMRFCFQEFLKTADADALARFRATLSLIRQGLLVSDLDRLPPRVLQSDSMPTEELSSQESNAPRDNLFEDLSTEVRTPHIPWASDVPGPSINTAVIVPAYGMRDAVELMQRFDVTCYPAMTWTRNRLDGISYGDAQFFTPGAVARRFDRALAPRRDVIIVGGVEWEMLHLEHRRRILEQVHGYGAGLVLIAPSECVELQELQSRSPEPMPVSIAEAVPWETLSAFAGDDPKEIVTCGTFGNGRWVALHYATNSTNQSLTPNAPVPCLNPWEYEYYQSLLGRAVFWAGKRELPVSVRVEIPEETALVAGPLSVKVGLESHEKAACSRNLSIELMAHSLATDERRGMDSHEVDLSSGQASVDTTLRWIEGGQTILSARVLSPKGEILGWGMKAVMLTSPLMVEEISMSRSSFASMEEVSGRIVLSGAVEKATRARLTFRDSWGRVLGVRERVPELEMAFRFPGVCPAGTSAHLVTCELINEAGDVLSSRSVEFGITGRKRPDFHLSIWEENETDYISGLWYKRFHDLGVDAIFYRNDRGNIDAAARLMARAGLFSAPMFACYSPKVEKGELGSVHTTCVHAPGVIEAGRERTREIAANWARFGALHYGDGSDKHMHGPCFCEYTLAAFRAYLRETYGEIAELNQAWHTSFTDWSEVIPDTLTQARERKQFRSWLEHTQFMEQAYVGYYRAMWEALHEVDPGAPMGPDGYGRLNSVDGSDWWQLLQTLSFYNLYTYQDPPQLEITRSLAQHFPNVKLRSLYYGSYTHQFGNDVFLRTIPWYALLHGYNGLFWWSANGKTGWAFSNGRLAGPNFRVTRSYLLSHEGINAVREGPIQLVRAARRDNNGIAIYYDQTAVHAATAYAHPSELTKNCLSLEQAIEDVGFQYDYVAAPQIRDNLLTNGGFRVLILPHVLAMSSATAKAIQSFAEGGGVVLAGIPPAQYNEHLEPFPTPLPLEDMFSEPDQENAVGRGWSMLLSEKICDYREDRLRSGGDTTREFLHRILTRVAIAPEMVPASAEFSAFPHFETIVYREGDARYIGLVNRGTRIRKDFQLTSPGVVYDLLKRKCLGEQGTLSLELAPGDVAFFAVYPGILSAIPISIPGGPFRAGETVRLQLAEDDSASQVRRVFSLSVFQPGGLERAEYSGVVELTSDSEGILTIPLAMNDPDGEWQIHVRDLITGRRQDATFQVSPCQRTGKMD